MRREPRFDDRAPAQAAVLVPLVHARRADGAADRAHRAPVDHSGQVAFPGGRVDPEDADIAAAALREAWEEVGLSAQYIEVLGSLPTYTTVTSFIVTPVVALVRPGFELNIDPYEVAEAFEVPLGLPDEPGEPPPPCHWSATTRAREWLSMPYQDGPHERYVWGATAAMLRNLYRFLARLNPAGARVACGASRRCTRYHRSG